jgi:hypothetical protein
VCVIISQVGVEVGGVVFCSNANHGSHPLAGHLIIHVGRGRGGVMELSSEGDMGGGGGAQEGKREGAAVVEASGDLAWIFFTREEELERRE